MKPFRLPRFAVLRNFGKRLAIGTVSLVCLVGGAAAILLTVASALPAAAPGTGGASALLHPEGARPAVATASAMLHPEGLRPGAVGRTLDPPADGALAAQQRMGNTAGYLSSDRLEGRGMGTHGLDLAADYIAARFREYGLKTDLWRSEPFQRFEVAIDAQLGPGNRLALLAPSSPGRPTPQAMDLILGQDFTPLAIGASAGFDLPLVFVGYGISVPASHYDDYAGLDVAGKAVVVLRHQPRRWAADAQSAGLKDVGQTLFRHKASNAYEHGAAAVIFCNDQSEAGKRPGREDSLLPFLFAGTTRAHPDLPILTCRRAVVDRMLASSRTSLAKLEDEIAESQAPRSRALSGWRVRGQTDIREVPCDVRNVAAEWPGVGPHAEETIILGAHYDHLGIGARIPGTKLREIYHGADDNASGIAVVLEVARTLAQRPAGFHRRMIFLAFTGEERGFWGSCYYTNHPLVPLAQTVAMLNLDMVGRLRDERLTINSVGTASGFNALLDEVNASCGLRLNKVPGASGRSDQASFYAKRIPNLHFFTGRHPDYHRPTDTFPGLNLEGMSRVAEFVGKVAAALAESPDRPQFVTVPLQRRGDSDPPFFGSIGDFTRQEAGYPVTSVIPGSPAERCGIQAGDVIVRFGRSRIGNADDLDDALWQYAAGSHVRVSVRRQNAAKVFEAVLAPPKQRHLGPLALRERVRVRVRRPVSPPAKRGMRRNGGVRAGFRAASASLPEGEGIGRRKFQNRSLPKGPESAEYRPPHGGSDPAGVPSPAASPGRSMAVRDDPARSKER